MVTQEEPRQDQDACPLCGGTGWQLVKEDGVESARRCDCHHSRRQRALLEQSGIPERYRHCTLDGFNIWNPKDPSLVGAQRIVRDWVDSYPAVDQGLLLMGKVGTGKTHLAVAAMHELITRHGVRARFVDFTWLVQSVQMTFDGSGGARDLIEPLVAAELLVLDELGAGKGTQWVMDLLYYLVNSRYLAKRLTLFTTNYLDREQADRETLTDRVSARIRSRLYEMCRQVTLYGEDYRLHELSFRRDGCPR